MKKLLLILTALVVISVCVMGSIAFLAENHPFYPGDFLYRWQLVAESLQFRLTFDDTRRADLAIDLAGRRLEELGSSIGGDYLLLAVDGFDQALDRVVVTILNAPLEERTRLLERLDTVLERAQGLLAPLANAPVPYPEVVALLEAVISLREANSPRQLTAIVEPEETGPAAIAAESVPFLGEDFDHSFYPLAGGHA
ncbi:MAG: DUF5667 domain-containing protein, partial [Chloroflexi bacterium]|nr:DUF5667 domain-containing protein [Chloroflexota bacterium]